MGNENALKQELIVELRGIIWRYRMIPTFTYESNKEIKITTLGRKMCLWLSCIINENDNSNLNVALDKIFFELQLLERMSEIKIAGNVCQKPGFEDLNSKLEFYIWLIKNTTVNLKTINKHFNEELHFILFEKVKEYLSVCHKEDMMEEISGYLKEGIKDNREKNSKCYFLEKLKNHTLFEKDYKMMSLETLLEEEQKICEDFLNNTRN